MSYISIIIPVYNSEFFLHHCIESVVHQTLSELEIIIIDDGSTDNSFKICEEYSKKEKRIILVHQDNKGQSSARNIGLKLATSKYIFFLDSDDKIYSSDSLYNMFSEMQTNQYDILIGQLYSENLDNKIALYSDSMKHLSGKDIMITLMKEKKFQGIVCANLYKRKLFYENGLLFIEGSIHEDEEMAPKLFYYSEKIGVYKEYCYYRSCNEQSTTQACTEKAIFKRIMGLTIVSDKQYDFFSRKPNLSEEDRSVILHRCGIFYLMAILSSYKIKNEKYMNMINKAFDKNKNILKQMKGYDIKFCILRLYVKTFGANSTIKILKYLGKIIKY